MLNILRDPRWGRNQETYGEDPWLSGYLGTAFVTGVQGGMLLAGVPLFSPEITSRVHNTRMESVLLQYSALNSCCTRS